MFNKSGSTTLTSKYDKLQNRIIVAFIEAFPQAPRKGLEVEADILPSKISHFQHASLYALRILRLKKNHPITKNFYSPFEDELSLTNEHDPRTLIDSTNYLSHLARFGKLLTSLINNNRLEVSDNEWNPPWLRSSIQVNIYSSSKEEVVTEHNQLLYQIPVFAAKIYTDGLTTEGKGSSIGYVIYPSNAGLIKCFSANLDHEMGIIDAESFCILKAIRHAKKLTRSTKIYFFSDSQASLKKIQNSSNFFSHQIRRNRIGKNIILT